MINNTTEGTQLLSRVLPVELLLQVIAVWITWMQLGPALATTPWASVLFVIFAANLAKVAHVLFHQYLKVPRMDGYDWRSNASILLIGASIGLSWGGGLVYLSSFGGNLSLATPPVTFIMANVLLAGLVGSALWARLFTCFALGLLLPPVYGLFQSQQWQVLAQWSGLIGGTIALHYTARRLEILFNRYRQSGRQNSTLLQEIAVAKEQTQRNHAEIQRAHENLKSEMEQRTRIEQQIRASERETTRILQDMQDIFFRVDQDGLLVRLSPSVQFLLGRPPNQLLGMKLASLFQERSQYLAFTLALQRQAGMLQNHETQLRHLSGHSVWVSVNAHYLLNQGILNQGILNQVILGQGTALAPLDQPGFEGSIRDVSESKKAAEVLYQEKNRLHVTLASIGDGVITTDTQGIVTYLNPVAESMSGWENIKATQKPLSQVLQLVNEDTRREVKLPLLEWIKAEKRGQLNDAVTLIAQRAKREYTIEITGSPILDSKNRAIGYVLVFRNMTKLRALTKQLTHQASHDALTGLINRSEFDNRVEAAVRSAQMEQKHHALCYVDLDQFKIVNDTCGHHAGDLLLKQITNTLQQYLRSADTLARLGGDEFGILLIGCDFEQAKQIAESVREAVEKYRFNWENRVFRIGASMGLVPIDSTTSNLDELLSSADAACYVAKESGRNRVHVMEPDDKAIAEQQGQMNLMQRIQRALEENQFELHVQTILPINTKATQGRRAEILLRMMDENRRGNITPPGAFISTAERYHLMPRIDQWVIKNTFDFLTRSQQQEAWEMCAINLSGQSLGEAYFLRWVQDAFKQSKVLPKIICFEITESAAVENLDNAIKFISTLRGMGCRFALDDFGSGVSSFGYLKNLQVDFIKIDGELVKDAASSAAGFAVIEAINNIAHVMKLETIAEHVEDLSLMQLLKKIGVDYAQGYAIDHSSLLQTAYKQYKAS